MKFPILLPLFVHISCALAQSVIFVGPQPANCFTSSDNRKGVCLPKSTCLTSGGIVAGTCGFLSFCCLYQGTCQSTTSANESYFVSPSYPDLETNSLGLPVCLFTFQRKKVFQKQDVCQIKLDFEEFTLGPPVNGLCGGSTDAFVVSGAASFRSSGLPPTGLCGTLTGQHMYFEVDPSDVSEPLLLVVTFSSQVAYNRKWSIRIQEIPCHSPFKAPSGCLQYFTSESDTLESLNFRHNSQSINVLDSSSHSGIATSWQSNYFNNLNYGVCVDRKPNKCGIRWTSKEFDFGGNLLGKSSLGIDGCKSSSSTSTGQMASGDFVTIQGSSSDGINQLQDRFCGQRLNSKAGETISIPLISYQRPFGLHVRTDEVGPEVGSRQKGFQMEYKQIDC